MFGVDGIEEKYSKIFLGVFLMCFYKDVIRVGRTPVKAQWMPKRGNFWKNHSQS